MKKINVVSTFSFMFVAVLLSKVMGLLRNVVFASHFGTGMEASAILTAQRIPLLLFDIGFAAVITGIFIPIFNRIIEKDGEGKAHKFGNQFTYIVGLVVIVLILLGELFTPQVVHIIASGFDAQTFELTVTYTRILLPIILFASITYVWVGILQSFNSFKIPAVISIVSNVITIAYLLFFNTIWGADGYVWVLLLSWVIQLLILVIPVYRLGFPFKWPHTLKNPYFKEIAIGFPMVFLSTCVFPINLFVNIRVASYLNQGQGVSAIEYANNLYYISVGVFSMVLTNLIFPKLSRLSQQQDGGEAFLKVVRQSVRLILLIVTPLLIFFVLFSHQIIAFIYERGTFGSEATYLTGTALFFFSFGMLGFALQEVFNKVFYAKHNRRIPLIIGIIAIIINGILSYQLAPILGIGGIGIAATFSITFQGLCLLAIAQWRIGSILNKDTLILILKVAVISIGLVLFVIGYNLWLSPVVTGALGSGMPERLLNLLLPLVGGLILFIILSFILRIEEINILKALRRKKND